VFWKHEHKSQAVRAIIPGVTEVTLLQGEGQGAEEY
jgi:hypothetical protein